MHHINSSFISLFRTKKGQLIPITELICPDGRRLNFYTPSRCSAISVSRVKVYINYTTFCMYCQYFFQKSTSYLIPIPSCSFLEKTLKKHFTKFKIYGIILSVGKSSIEVWLSLVEYFVRDEGAAGSNPVTSTKKRKVYLV